MKNKLLLLAIVGTLFMMSLLTGLSYAIWTVSGTHVKANMSNVGCLEVAITETADSAINLRNTYPMSDEQGAALEPFRLVVQNTCSMTVNYELNLEQLYTSDYYLGSNYIKIKVNDESPVLLSTKDSTVKDISTSVDSKIIGSGTLIRGASDTYNVSLWVTEEATQDDVSNRSYKGKFNVISTATATSFNVTFKPNGGVFDDTTTEPKTIQKRLNQNYGVLPNVSQDGKTFVGWFTSLTGGEMVTSDTKFTTADNIELYAHWEE